MEVSTLHTLETLYVLVTCSNQFVHYFYAKCWPACTWFLEITFMRIWGIVCVCVCVRVCVSTRMCACGTMCVRYSVRACVHPCGHKYETSDMILTLRLVK